MSQPVLSFEGDSMEPERQLTVVGGVEEGTGGDVAKYRHPDYDFDIEERKFVDGILEVTNHQRLRVAAKTLAERVPEFKHLASSNERKRIFDQRNAYMKARIKVDADGTRQTYNRGQLVDTDSAVDAVFYGMAERNHPTAQLIGHIADRYEDKLRLVDLNWLYSQLVTLTGWDEMKQVYEQQLAAPEQTQ